MKTILTILGYLMVFYGMGGLFFLWGYLHANLDELDRHGKGLDVVNSHIGDDHFWVAGNVYDAITGGLRMPRYRDYLRALTGGFQQMFRRSVTREPRP